MYIFLNRSKTKKKKKMLLVSFNKELDVSYLSSAR